MPQTATATPVSDDRRIVLSLETDTSLDLLVTPVERIPTSVFADSKTASRAVAAEIADLIRSKADRGEQAVLGLATGSTPTSVYDELIRLHQEEGLSFANVVTFNLDEYFPMPPDELQSYVRFMKEHLFDHVDIDPANAHVPDGTLSIDTIAAYCADYEQKIADAGGIDIQLLGIGRTGHIGFNEPGSGRDSRTRLITLDRVTRLDAASDFFGENNVPRRAITMGVATILSASRVIMMAWGENKAPVVREAVEGPISPIIAASYLQEHENARVVLDTAAADKLTRFQSPWLLGTMEQFGLDWTTERTRTAAIWLAGTVEKPLLKLTDEDFNEHGLQELVALRGGEGDEPFSGAYDINVEVFKSLQRTITGWPGGKPEGRPDYSGIERSSSAFPKRCLVFSPHPDDDVISMGGTLIRLCDQGHDVSVAYQTSGNIAVFDDAALRHADFVAEAADAIGFDTEAVKKAKSLRSELLKFTQEKEPGDVDHPRLQAIKGMIRRTEARNAAQHSGVSPERIHFLDLPFYETGRVRKQPLGEEDVRITADLLREVKPHQIYAAGDLSDPHGTHRTCLAAILEAIDEVKDEPWFAECEVWLYRGAWQEWEVGDIEMAVPLAPSEVERKRRAIFKHESQKDKALFPGTDEREFWERAEDRTRETARRYDALGLAEYEAIEGFVRWKGGEA
ncbi:MAG: glucosamine-6-phosphate deaminase [Planctomycetota bacterium]